ncbi:MAG: M48 family metalloprotease [Tildeniella nuda ZEHNDER 1965/U140]|jgi:Zn-dependent protease with chaperone function|nr:M48 family metalloprotease [Tildeniella nuda ZEHNDER 1965/U140]
MPPVPDSSSLANDFPALEAGLSALREGDYKTAIVKLESLSLPPDHAFTSKAQMGLVTAYARTRQPLRAAALCQTLRQSNNAQISDWATRSLLSLTERNPQLFDQFEALSTEADAPNPDASSPHLASLDKLTGDDLTGFTPFDPAAPPNLKTVGDRGSFLDAPPLPEADQNGEPTTAIQPPDASDHVNDGTTANRQPYSKDETAILAEGMTGRIRTPKPVAAPRHARSSTQAAPSGKTVNMPLEDQPPFYPTWRQAGRLKQGKSLGKVKFLRLLLLQAGTAVALFWMVQAIAYNTTLYYSIALTKIPFLGLSRQLFHPPVVPILIFLGILFVASRWLLDGLLTIGYGLQPLSLSKLATYSPETAQSLQRFCRQQRIPMPALGVLPTTAPIAFSYGCLPHVTRTVVSQGLLEQLADDEIATVYASEVGHISRFDVPLMSLVTVLIQIPYTIYRSVSDWGSRQQAAISRVSASILAAISYGMYALLRWVALWLSRQRVYYSDRVSAELTGNPNGLTRALLKIAIGTAKDVQTQKQTSYLLEGFDLLTPLGQRMATTVGSVYPHVPIESVLEWERTNPYRNWLAINNSHPLTGDRLNLLSMYARHWKLDTELEWGERSAVSGQRSDRFTSRQWRSLLLQGAPFFGLALGFAMAYLFAALGWIGWRTNINQLSWMYGDHALRQGLPLVGFSIGTFIRINPLFPDVPFSNAKAAGSSDSLVALLKPADRIPIDRQPVQLEGKFIGRAEVGNLLSQDLLLQTPTGIVRLHCLSNWGPIGNLFPQAIRATALLNQDVVVIGWFRHGATPWIDVDTIRTLGGRVSRSGHPVWSTVLGAIAATWGIYTLFRGSIF